MIKDLLFAEYLLEDEFENRNSSIMGRVDSIQKDQFLNTSDQKIIEHLESVLRMDALTLYEDKKTMEQSEVEVDVSHIRARNRSGRSGPLLVKGIRVVVSIPYTGDEELWRYAPSRTGFFNCGIVRRKNNDGIGYVDIIYEQPIDEDKVIIKKFIGEQINGIKSSIAIQEQKIQTFNNGL